MKYTYEFETIGGNLTYIGKADTGTLTSASTWQLTKLTYDGSNNVTAMLSADGNAAFDNIWDNRAGYSYS